MITVLVETIHIRFVSPPRRFIAHEQSTWIIFHTAPFVTGVMVVILVDQITLVPTCGTSSGAMTFVKFAGIRSSTGGYASGSHFAARTCSSRRIAMCCAAEEQADHSAWWEARIYA